MRYEAFGTIIMILHKEILILYFTSPIRNQEKNGRECVVMFLLSFVHNDDSTNVEKEKCIP